MVHKNLQLHDVLDTDESDLEAVPRVFIHKKCGGQTHLNAPCVRRYLRDPLRLVGAGSSVYCAVCSKNASSADCHWLETGENVRTYFRCLIGNAYLANSTSWIGRFLLLYGVVGILGIAGAVLGYIHKGGGDASTGYLIAMIGTAGLVVFLAIGLVVQYRTYTQCVEEYLKRGEH